MAIHCNTQKVEFDTDEVEELGEVSLEEALNIFGEFPFEEELRKAKESEMPSCMPTISFKNENGSELGIWAENEEGFFLHYQNIERQSDFYVSNNITLNPEGLSAEDFIELFFHERIEELLDLTPSEELRVQSDAEINADNIPAPQSIYVFEFDRSIMKGYIIYVSLFFILWAGLMLVHDIDGGGIYIVLKLFLALSWLPGALACYSYWKRNNGVVITIDTDQQTLSYKRKGEQIKFKRSAIATTEISRAHAWSHFNGLSYIRMVLKDGRHVVITSFITEPEKIAKILHLNYRYRFGMIPLP